jgi:hypothetical protein
MFKRISTLRRIWLESLWDVEAEAANRVLWEGSTDEDGQVTPCPVPIHEIWRKTIRRTRVRYLKHLKRKLTPAFWHKLLDEYDEVVCQNEMQDYFDRGDNPPASSFAIHLASIRDLDRAISARLYCKIFGHDLEAETFSPQSGGEDIWCNRCDWSARVWHG